MEIYKSVITQKGLELLAKAQAGQCNIEFTRAASGSGEYEDENLGVAVCLKSEKQTFKFSGSPQIINDQVELCTLINNDDLTEGYYLLEYGIFAKDPDENEILYAISIILQEKADWIGTVTETGKVCITMYTYLKVANAGTVIIDQLNHDYVSQENFDKHISDKENPHAVTKSQVGLQNVDNTSDKNKPVSDAQKTAFGARLNIDGRNLKLVNGNGVVLNTVVTQDTIYTHPSSHPPSIITQDSNNRFMTDAERNKLSGIATNANNYSHPTTAGYNHIPSGGSEGQILQYSSPGVATWSSNAKSFAHGYLPTEDIHTLPSSANGVILSKYLITGNAFSNPDNGTYLTVEKDGLYLVSGQVSCTRGTTGFKDVNIMLWDSITSTPVIRKKAYLDVNRIDISLPSKVVWLTKGIRIYLQYIGNSGDMLPGSHSISFFSICEI